MFFVFPGSGDGRRDQLNLFNKTQPTKKRRKSRTAFTNQQIYQLEKRFLYQKYLTPADRDELASGLDLSTAQVITWFQNRRAKLKRDLEELKADVTAAKSTDDECPPVGSLLDERELFEKHGLRKCERKEDYHHEFHHRNISPVISSPGRSPIRSPVVSPARSRSSSIAQDDCEKIQNKDRIFHNDRLADDRRSPVIRSSSVNSIYSNRSSPT